MIWSRRVDLNHRSPGSEPGGDGQTPLRLDVLDHPAGVEPAAFGFARRRSCPLSYGWKSVIVFLQSATLWPAHPGGHYEIEAVGFACARGDIWRGDCGNSADRNRPRNGAIELPRKT